MHFADCVIACAIIVLRTTSVRTSPPVQDITEYEEYVVEHEISTAQANDSASLIDLGSYTPPPGCQTCTRAEKYYCLSSDFINDHCCCDRRHREEFGFIPHTCYLGAKLCKTITQDCVEYTRLKACCCRSYILEKWIDRSSASVAFYVLDARFSFITTLIIVHRYLFSI